MKASKNYTVRASKVYPESSKRQALHKFRVAQGGPGITEGKDPQPKGGK